MTKARAYKHLWMVEEGRPGEDGKPRTFWTKVGVAFENRDGSWSLHLSAMPVSGKLQMRDAYAFGEKEREEVRA